MHTIKTNIAMSEAELVLVEEAKNCTLYTILFLSEDDTEFEQFFNKFKDDLEPWSVFSGQRVK